MKERREEAGVGHSVWCHLDTLLFALVPCVYSPLLTLPQPSKAKIVSPLQRVTGSEECLGQDRDGQECPCVIGEL